MKKYNWLFISIMSTVLLVGCSDVPTEEDITKAVTEKVEEEVNKAVEQTIDKVKDEGKQTAEDLVQEGTNKLNEWLGGTSEKFSEDSESSEVLLNGTTEQIPVELVRVSDGDTFVFIDSSGKEKKLRMLLVDGPELSKNHPFAEESKARTKELLESGEVSIETDIGPKSDHYSRILAYVYVNGKSVQTTLLEEGLVRIAYITPPNTRYLDEFKAAEKIAKDKGIGIWSIENYATDSGFKP